MRYLVWEECPLISCPRPHTQAYLGAQTELSGLFIKREKERGHKVSREIGGY